MSIHPLLLPMTAHLIWVVLLYVALTVVRAPAVWGLGRNTQAAKTCVKLEARISANLSNQFEWPLFFYSACVLLLMRSDEISTMILALAWVFVAGRVMHSAVQVLTSNVRLRGLVFTLNFLSVLGLWAGVLIQYQF